MGLSNDEAEANAKIAEYAGEGYFLVSGPDEFPIAERFAAVLVREHYDFETGEYVSEETKDVEEDIDKRDHFVNLWEIQGWTVTVMQNIVTAVKFEWVMEKDPVQVDYSALGTAFTVHGLNSHSEHGYEDELKTLLYDASVAALYDGWADPPGPGDYWVGWDPEENLAFDEEGPASGEENHHWTAEQRAEWGGRPWREQPGLASSAMFRSGTFPYVFWTQYWLQAEEDVPPDAGEAARTYLLLATSTEYDEYGEVASEQSWTATVGFAVGETKTVSETKPVVVWSDGEEPEEGVWVEARADGTLLARPPVERGKVNRVRVVPVEIVTETYKGSEEFVELSAIPLFSAAPATR